MKKNALFIFFLLTATLFVACDKDKDNDTNKTYSEALVTSMTFQKNDSFPGLAEARFTIITESDTGLIFNQDSLRFGTCLDSVIPMLRFNHTPAYTVFYTGKDSTADTILYTGADTINFSQQPVELYVMASDQEHAKRYKIYVNVHQVDPDLYVWERLNEGVFQTDGAESKAIMHNGSFMLFVNNGFSTQLYTSQDARNWSSPSSISALPTNCSVRKIIEADGTLYYPAADKLYTSNDGTAWTANSVQGFEILNMLYCFNDSVWGIAKLADGKLQMCNMAKGGKMALTGDILPDNFPVSDYAAITFPAASNRKRAMIVGGFDLAGNSLNTRWNIEYLKGNGYNMADFSIEQPNFESLSGAAIVWYNNELHMFGSVSADNTISESSQLISVDDGMRWLQPDTAKNVMPDTYENRQKASVLVDEDNHYIYIIGGQTRNRTFSDVYRGRLTKLTFKENN